MISPYSTTKIAHHPLTLQALRFGEPTPPVFVQIFPTNICNAHCDHCSYGHWLEDTGNPKSEEWKNHERFRNDCTIPCEKMIETIQCLADIGCKAIEITGGGEPLVYPHWFHLIDAIAQSSMELGVVSNGTLLNAERIAHLLETKLRWVRISIDAGSSEEYCATRHVGPLNWHRAWDAVRLLGEQRQKNGLIVGVGYVIDRDNWRGVYDACRLAKECGADNIRLSLSFTPQGSARWSKIRNAVGSLVYKAASELEDDTFRVYNLVGERAENVDLARQEYPFCFWKEVACVIAADQCVYSCCSWAYNKAGLIGSIENQTFTELWNSELAMAWRQSHDPRRHCRIVCLYEKRNKEALAFMMHRDLELSVRSQGEPPHANFI